MKHVKPYAIFENSEPEIRREYYRDGSVKEERWYINGERHRVDGPAIIRYNPDGTFEEERWYLNGKRHREDGPAAIYYYPDGNVKQEIWYLRDKEHRENGPADIYYNPNGSAKQERWYLSGKRHRVDGPAYIKYTQDGRVEEEGWYLRDTQLSKAQWVEKTPGLSPEELVEISTNDPDSEVRRAAKRNPKFPEDLEGWAINLDDWT